MRGGYGAVQPYFGDASGTDIGGNGGSFAGTGTGTVGGAGGNAGADGTPGTPGTNNP